MSSAIWPLSATSTTSPAPASSSAPTCWFRSLSSTSSTRAPWMVVRLGALRGPWPRWASADRAWPPRARMVVSNSCEGLTGLVSMSTMPAFASSFCTSSRPAAVTMTECGRWGSSASARWVAKPSMPGIFQSRKAISQGCPAASAALALATASSPELAVVTAKLMLPSSPPKICRACSLSSTTSTCRPRRSGSGSRGAAGPCPGPAGP